MEYPPYLRQIKVVSCVREYGFTIPLHVRVIACTSLLDLARACPGLFFYPQTQVLSPPATQSLTSLRRVRDTGISVSSLRTRARFPFFRLNPEIASEFTQYDRCV